MLAIGITSLVCALSWINKPYAGFLMFTFPRVGSMSETDWYGSKAGLRNNDQVLEINGKAIFRGKEVVEKARSLPIGSPVHYMVKTVKGTTLVEVRTDIFTVKKFLMVFMIPYVGGMILYVLGYIAFILKPYIRSSWVFFILCFTMGSYMVTGFEIQSTYIFIYFHYFITPIFPAVLFHLGWVFPDRKRILERYPLIEYIFYFPALWVAFSYVLYLVQVSFPMLSGYLGWVPDIYASSAINRILQQSYAAGLFILIFHSFFRAYSIVAKQRARMILFGVSIAFLPPAMVGLGVYFFRVNFPYNFLTLFVIFFPASIAYSIVKHNLFDSDEIIKRTVGYFIVTAIIIAAYALISIFSNVYLAKYEVAKSQVFPILFTLFVILIFNPLRNRIQSLVDKIFFRKEYNYGEVIDKISGAISSLLDLGQILKSLMKTLMQDIFLTTSSVMLLSPDGDTFKVYMADGEAKDELESVIIEKNSPLIQIFEDTKKELTKFDFIEDPKFADHSQACLPLFEKLKASLMIPLIFQDNLIGLLSLGDKKSGKYYNREDIELFSALAKQSAVAIENARLFEENLEKQRMEEELNIARDLQVSMLPAESPEIEGLEIAAYSLSAREVGGDFYDFIDMGEEKVGMLIGDVTGKSVSGALVMSASRSVFRMLSEEDLTVADIMIRANRRIKQDVKSGMFVALLYAVVDAREKTIDLCSAGQTQPVYIPAGSGDVSLVETQGDTFPLGILEDVEYVDTRLTIQPGDKIVFYTDGIVEAMNADEEMFGFERLLEVLQTTRDKDVTSLMNETIEQVNAFAGDKPQHDDITIIAVGVSP